MNVATDQTTPETANTPMLARSSTWDRVSVGYDTEVRPSFETFSALALKIASVTRDMRVLDLAAGPGTLVGLAAAIAALGAVI